MSFENTGKPLVLVQGPGFRVQGSNHISIYLILISHISNLKSPILTSHISYLISLTKYSILSTQYFCRFFLFLDTLLAARSGDHRRARVLLTFAFLLFTCPPLLIPGHSITHNSTFITNHWFKSHISHLISHISNQICLNSQYSVLNTSAGSFYS